MGREGSTNSNTFPARRRSSVGLELQHRVVPAQTLPGRTHTLANSALGPEEKNKERCHSYLADRWEAHFDATFQGLKKEKHPRKWRRGESRSRVCDVTILKKD